MPANLENAAVATGLEKVSFHSNSKKGNGKECSNYCTISLISNASKNSAQNSPSQASTVGEPRTSRRSRSMQKRQSNQKSNYQHPLDHGESKEIPEKNTYFTDDTKAFNCVDHKNVCKILFFFFSALFVFFFFNFIIFNFTILYWFCHISK